MGNSSTVMVVFEENYKLLYRIVYSITQNREDTFDVLQETALKAMERFNHDLPCSDIAKMLIVTAKNTAISMLRKKNKEVQLAIWQERIGGDDVSVSLAVLYNFDKLGELIPGELFSHILSHLLEGTPLLQISKDTNIPYDKLRYWKNAFLSELRKTFL